LVFTIATDDVENFAKNFGLRCELDAAGNNAVTKINFTEEAEAAGPLAEAYRYWQTTSGRAEIPGLWKALSARPDFLRQAVDFSGLMLFSDGHLSRRHKEMIGAYASHLNSSQRGPGDDGHAALPPSGALEAATLRALLNGDVEKAGLTAKERALLGYVAQVSKAAYRTTPADVQKLRDAGWSEEQIAETVYLVALFAMFHRIANAFGVPVQSDAVEGEPQLER
jgi:uncharacterized peroxidase-related enzyme